MKFLLRLPYGEELYAAGDRRYKLTVTSHPVQNPSGVNINAEAMVFTESGWLTVTKFHSRFEHQMRRCGDEVKDAETEALRRVREQALEILTAFHDG